MLENTVEKAQKTTSSVWKWILGAVIVILIFFAAWMLKRKYDELVRLRAEKKLAEERKKDMELHTANEKDESMVAAFKTEAEYLNNRVKEREAEILKKEREYIEAKKRIEDAKNWKELEDQARRTPRDQ